jgi:hypothetical protein
MSQFSALPERAFISLRDDLQKCPVWEAIDATAATAPSAASAVTLSTLPRRVGWKVRVHWAVAALLTALGLVDAEAVKAADAAFDTSLRRVHHKLALDLTDPDEATRQAAARAQALLLPDGLAPARLPYDQEVDWGRQAVARAQETLSAEDMALLGLAPFMESIARTSDALALVLGLSPGKTRDIPKSRRLRESLAEGQRAFKVVYQDILWHHEHTSDPDERHDLSTLIDAFNAILVRYSVRIPTR